MYSKRDVARPKTRLGLCAVVLAAFVLSGCEFLGPRALEAGRTDYNAAAKSTAVDQLLLNIVRMRFNDRPYFLEVSSISSTAEAGAAFGGTDEKGIEGGIRYLERPTIIYTPLTGESFVRQLLSPVTLETLLLLRDAGWEMDDILSVFAERMNGVPNASTGGDSTPEGVPEFQEFKELGEAVDELEDRDFLLFAAGDAVGGNEIVIAVDPRARGTQEFVTFTRILKLNPEAPVYRMRVGVIQDSEDTIVIKTRPIMSALFFVGQGVQVPQEWLDAGSVNFAVDPLGNPFDWDQVHGDLILIKSSESEPPNSVAYSKVEYANRWFYIKAGDVDSKETLTMLSIVLTLKAGGIKTERPVLTLPVGG